MEITKDIRYAGVNDHEIDLFEGQYKVENGMAYNSYVIMDEKIAVMDTVDASFYEEWMQNIKQILGSRTPDYLVVQHMEPDHSANISAFLETFPDTVIVSSAPAFNIMKQFFGTDYADRRQMYNPLWWLMLGGKEGEVPGLTVRIKAAFPVLWCKEYYTVEEKVKETRAPCVCCDNTGKVTIKGVEYACPRCKGDWREKEVVGTTTVYSVAKWVLESISVNQYGLSLTFKQTNSTERWGGSLQMRQSDFHDMVYRDYGKTIKVYDDYKAAMAEVKRLNAAEREKQA